MSKEPDKIEVDPKRGPLPGEFLLSTVSVVGTQFHEWRARMHRFVFPLRVKLEAEPSNEHDQWAVRVLAWPKDEEKPSQVGHLIRGQKTLSLLLQNGHKLRVEVRDDKTGVSPSVDIWMRKGP